MFSGEVFLTCWLLFYCCSLKCVSTEGPVSLVAHPQEMLFISNVKDCKYFIAENIWPGARGGPNCVFSQCTLREPFCLASRSNYLRSAGTQKGINLLMLRKGVFC